MKKRIFVGIRVDKKLQNTIRQFEDIYLTKLPVRIIDFNNLHITLIPPWYEDTPSLVIQRLQEEKFSVSPFKVKFTNVTFGPNPKRPRLIWAEGDVPGDLVHLKRLIEKKLKKKPEKRDYRLHLTLARFREKDFKLFKQKELKVSISWSWEVANISFFESKLKRSGAEYTVLSEVKLVAGDMREEKS